MKSSTGEVVHRPVDAMWLRSDLGTYHPRALWQKYIQRRAELVLVGLTDED
jgi:hypothetical protein